MKLSLRPQEIPFMIGDEIWVDQACGDTQQYPYFQAKIIQIILDGSLSNSVVIRQREERHDLAISNGIYDLKPCGDRAGLPRLSVTVDFFRAQNLLFKTEQELVNHQQQKHECMDGRSAAA